MRRFVKNIYLLSLGVFVGVSSLTSCKDDLSSGLFEGNLTPGEYTLQVPLAFSSVENRTRANFQSPVGIKDLWVGVFDATDGRLIGMNVIPDVGQSFEEHAGDNFYKIPVNILINDDHKTVFIAGIANYKGDSANPIMGYTSSDPSSKVALSSLVENIKTWQDYYTLGVDIESAENYLRAVENNGQNFPLLSGLMSTKDHGNNTVDAKGKPQNNYSDRPAEITILGADPFEGIKIPDGSFIHLRRLYSQVNVEVSFSGNVSKVSDISWSLGNVPTAVFLQERTTYENADNAEDWATVTPAFSDLLDNGYLSFEDPENVTSPYFQVKENEKLNGEDKSFTFSFWQYENKHWGRNFPTNSYTNRERRYAGTEIFESLCPAGSDSNNGASYFVLKCHVVQKDGSEGDAEFFIHEGYCSKPDGDPAAPEDIDSKARDFSVFRNTRYNYTVTVNGLNSIIVKANRENEDYNPGVTGTVWDISPEVLDVQPGETATLNLTLPEGYVSWYIAELNDNDELEGFGEFAYDGNASEVIKNVWAESGDINTADVLYQATTIGGSSLQNYESDGKTPVEVKIVNPSDNKTRALYLLTESKSSDGRSSVVALRTYILNPRELPKAEFVEGAFVKNNTITIGANRSTLKWTQNNSSDRIEYYKIYLNGAQYATIDVNDPVYCINGEYNYKLPTDWMLNMFNKDGSNTKYPITIEACCSNTKENIFYKNSSTTTELAFDSKGKDWKFSDTVWSGFSDTNNTEESISSNGLTVSEGGANLSKGTDYIQTGGSGSTTRRVFSFPLYDPVELTVVVCTTTTSEDTSRYLNVQIGNNVKQIYVGDIDYNKPADQRIKKIQITEEDFENIFEGETVYIYSTGNLRIFEIKYLR